MITEYFWCFIFFFGFYFCLIKQKWIFFIGRKKEIDGSGNLRRDN